MGRLDIEKQKELEPKRMEYARSQIMALGYEINEENATTLKFTFKGSTVTLFPYSGWHWRYIPILLLCGANGVGKDEPPDVTDTPGVRYAVTESDFW